MRDKEDGVYCDHIESKLPKFSKASVLPIYTGRIDDFWIRQEIKMDRIPEIEIVERLVAFGLDPYEVELLMLRYIEEKTMKQIVVEQGWINASSATHYLRRALEKLRAGKFSFR